MQERERGHGDTDEEAAAGGQLRVLVAWIGGSGKVRERLFL